ncbi:MAG: glutathione peroxidase [Nitrospirales bacterium]|nr:glutathione peroxidase [Nitrospirales bacterium]
MSTLYDMTCRTINDQSKSLADFRDKVLLIVNTASQCGFTPHFKGLETLYQTYHSQGLEVLGFPCNQSGKQDPGNNEEILSFCQTNYQVTFPMFAKIDVNGLNAHPLFEHLKSRAPGVLGSEAIKWNFTKFLVDRTGDVRQRFAPTTTPADIEPAIQGLLTSSA